MHWLINLHYIYGVHIIILTHLVTACREAVFADPRTLISRNALDRELEQAVRFLHDNGTMLHYEDPLLSDLYFVDPQWLCDMLAHIVTVREINPLVKDGKSVNLSNHALMLVTV